ncbi:hypothetical protein P3521_03750 [Vibrio parahaemolyticus]|uniref:hypothetical protein n=1 Tax=Vibrio parahaemolyticus TaxID=670 RepID=UPI00226B48E6|nr:hypothetical protein [Vibrio parahaemolyticus]MCX8816971.1 hypothetical protein [Vibrio parahaemolyticus]MDF4579375.1 hypothetical protein [Vibrio parahaemolyticus]MDF4668716.1 hypothetical protein [Vibrio parahaemolyticus]HAV1412735.1 hypothetical protein [Vibrio parahaemolyticus]HAV2004817.1 hypothetical protein [Vibrio parahaemolyticus]
MTKFEVQKGRSLPSKIGLIRGGGLIDRKNMHQSDDELKVLLHRGVIKEHKKNPVTEVVKRALNIDEKNRDKQLQNLDSEIEEKQSVLAGLESSTKEQQSILDGLKSAIEEQGVELESKQKQLAEIDAEIADKKAQLSADTDDESELSDGKKSNGPSRPVGVKK